MPQERCTRAHLNSVCSAYALTSLIKKININSITEIILPEGPRRTSEKIIKKFEIDTTEKTPQINPEVTFVLDTGSLGQLGDSKNFILTLDSITIFIENDRIKIVELT